MRDTVWNYIYLWYVNIYYYGLLRHKLERLNSALKFGSSFLTMIAIACWGYWPNLSAFWMALITSTQVISLFAECTGLSEKIMRLNYWAEDAQKIINKITALWDKIEDIDDTEIRCHLQTLRDEWSALDARFIHGLDSYDSKVLGLAEKEAKGFLDVIHIANHGTSAETREEVVL